MKTFQGTEQILDAFGKEDIDTQSVLNFHFGYIKPDEETQEFLNTARNQYLSVLNRLHTIPNSRERALAITKLEESLMFATKAIVVASK